MSKWTFFPDKREQSALLQSDNLPLFVKLVQSGGPAFVFRAAYDLFFNEERDSAQALMKALISLMTKLEVMKMMPTELTYAGMLGSDDGEEFYQFVLALQE